MDLQTCGMREAYRPEAIVADALQHTTPRNAAHAQHACIELIRILLTGANGIVERFKDQLVVSTRVRALSHGITSTFGSSHAQDLSPSSKFTLNPEQGACAKKRHAQCFHDQRTQSIAVPCRLQVEPLELLSRNRCHAL